MLGSRLKQHLPDSVDNDVAERAAADIVAESPEFVERRNVSHEQIVEFRTLLHNLVVLLRAVDPVGVDPVNLSC